MVRPHDGSTRTTNRHLPVAANPSGKCSSEHIIISLENREVLCRRCSATCCFLFLLSVHSLPTSTSFPFTVRAVEGSEGRWVVSLLQMLQVQSNQTCQIRGFPQFEVKTLRRYSYGKDFTLYYSLPHSNITSPFISDSCVSLRTFITSWQCLWFRLL